MIERRVFGTLSSGEEVIEYVVTNDRGTGFSALNFGGYITSVRVPDRDGNLVDVALGFPNIEDYEQGRVACAGGLIGRVGNRIGGASFTLEGRRYDLLANNGENNLHSGPKGFQFRMWQVVPVEPCTLLLRLTSPDGENGFPGNLDVEVSYTFDNSDTLFIHYRAFTDKTTLCNMTNHSYFNLNGRGDVKDHLLQVNAAHVTEAGKDLIPTGRLIPQEEKPYGFAAPTRIGDALARLDEDELFAFCKGVDFNYCAGHDRETKLIATLYSPVTGIEMNVMTDQPGVQIYTGNSFNIDGKNGQHYGPYAGVALETQHYPDAPHHPEFPSIVLRPQDTYDTFTAYCFGVREEEED